MHPVWIRLSNVITWIQTGIYIWAIGWFIYASASGIFESAFIYGGVIASGAVIITTLQYIAFGDIRLNPLKPLKTPTHKPDR